jgi:hypothetical protein
MCREHVQVRRGYRISGLLLAHEATFTCEGMRKAVSFTEQYRCFYFTSRQNAIFSYLKMVTHHCIWRHKKLEVQELTFLYINTEFQEATTIGGKKSAFQRAAESLTITPVHLKMASEQ